MTQNNTYISIKSSATKRIALLLFLFSSFNYVYLKHTLNESNPANRVALCLALWEDGSVVIDKYYHFSVDHCLRDGHYYCDKAPGVSFLAMPFVVAGYEALKIAGRTSNLSEYDPNFPKESSPEPNINYKILLIVGSLVVSLISAVALCVNFILLRQLGVATRVALFGAFVLGFGTPFGVWSTVMFGHAPAGAFLLFGTALAMFLSSDRNNNSFKEKRIRKIVLWIVTGFFLAYVVWIEYTSAVPACIIGIAILCTLKERGDTMSDLLKTTGLLFLGALPIAVCFFIYNTIAFGGPFTLGYKYDLTNFPEMGKGFYGIQLPNFHVLLLTLFSPQHGILWFSPVLILSLPLALYNIYRNHYRALNVACLLIPVYYFLMNSSYVYWKQTYVSCRHVTGSLPFLVLPIFLAWSSLGKIFHRIIVFLSMVSLVICFMSINLPASEAMILASNKLVFVTREFLAGNIRNLLYYAGVNPYVSLLVLLVVWGIFIVLFCRACSEKNNPPD
ncbi:MAG: hypothetical protein LBI18_05360 [Planctomycetaceae bacterium]|jgi:hypothetical protein|nr:hypothetical protein [Planctomycetaceae bacterium]